jgi:hypothetical protein
MVPSPPTAQMWLTSSQIAMSLPGPHSDKITWAPFASKRERRTASRLLQCRPELLL